MRCYICNKELGFGSKKCELKDGLVCAECVKKAGLVARKNLKGLTIEALKKGIEQNNEMLARQQIFKPTSEVGFSFSCFNLIKYKFGYIKSVCVF